MKKIIALIFVLAFIFVLIGCAKSNTAGNTIQFHDHTLNAFDLSQDTLKWLAWYNALREEEQLSVSFVPKDILELCGYNNADDMPAETN